MKGKKIIIGILCGIGAVAIGIGAWNFKTISNSIRKWTSTPEEYFYYIEERSAKEAFSVVGTSYEALTESFDTKECVSYEGTAEVEFGERLQALFLDEEDAGTGTLSKVGMTYSGGRGADAGTSQSEVSLFINDNEVIDGTYWLNNWENVSYLQIPKLSGDIIKFSMTDSEQSMLVPSDEFMAFLKEWSATLPEKEKLEAMLLRYYCAGLSEIKEVEEETSLLSTEGVYMRCTKLTATLNGEELSKVLESAVEEMLQDKELEELIVTFTESQHFMDEGELYDNIYKSLNELRYSARELKSFDEESEITVWVDKTGAVVGHKLSIGRKNGFYYAVPREKNKIGFTFELEADGTELSLTGTGSVNKSEFAGDYKILSEGLSYFEGTFSTDVKKALRNNGTGIVTLYPAGKAKDLLKELDEELEAYKKLSFKLQDLNLSFSFETKDNTSTVAYSFLAGDELLLGISSEQTMLPGGEVTFPEDKNTVEFKNESEFVEWLAETDVQGVLNNFHATGLPKSWFAGAAFEPDALRYMAALGYVDAEDYQKAKEMFLALEKSDNYEDSADYILFCDAMLLFEAGKPEEAEKLLDKIQTHQWNMDAGICRCYYALGERYLAEENYEKAEYYYKFVYYRQSLYSSEYEDAFTKYYYSLAMLSMENGDYEDAESKLSSIAEDYAPAAEALKECEKKMEESMDAMLARPEYQLTPVDYEFYSMFVTLPPRYVGIPVDKVTESEYESYIALMEEDALLEGKVLSEKDKRKLREDCEELSYTNAIMYYMLKYGEAEQVDEDVVTEKAKIDMYRHKEKMESLGVEWEEYLGMFEHTEEELLTMYKADRREREKLFVMAYVVAKEEGLTVSEADYDYYVADMCEDFGISKKEFLRVNSRPVLEDIFLVEKGLDFLVEHAEIR